MNRFYHLIWNHTLGALVPVAEITRGTRGGPVQRRSPLRPRLTPLRRALALALGLAPALALARQPVTSTQLHGDAFAGTTVSVTQPFTPPAVPQASAPLPVGGQVVSGQAAISQGGNTLTIDQTSQNTIINWQSFNIGANYTVAFQQPGSSSVALNRVLGTDPSAIYGHLNANGQVFLVNPYGVYFAPGARVDVGGIVASTLDISDQNFLSGNYRFSGTSTAGVRNDGAITSARGGYVAFIGRGVDNNGAITTPGGTTALGAGSSVNLTLAGNRLLSFQVSGAALQALAANGGIIQADGGTVILSAQAKDALLQTVVNNSGRIQAQTVANHGGTIELLGGDSGTLQVAGMLDVSAPNGGDGGFIETSSAYVNIAGGATITAASANGTGGSWLIDPVDLTIDANAATAISTALNTGTSVTEQTTATGTSNVGSTNAGSTNSGLGDINVNAPISWTTGNATLTLSAYHSLNINAPITATSNTGKLVLVTNNSAGGTSSGGTLNIAAPVDLNAASKLSINGINYTVIDSITALQNIGSSSTTLTGHYALATNLDDNNQAFTPIDIPNTNSGGFPAPPTPFTGTFEGLGHTINNLTINQPSAYDVGLFGAVGTNGVVRDVGLVGDSVSGGSNTAGELVGHNDGTIINAYATGSVSSGASGVIGGGGGLVGYNTGTITDAYATGSVSGGGSNFGGLVGNNNGTISNSYATGNVSGSFNVGGLVGVNQGTISNSYATGSATGSNSVGGLVGFNGYTVSNSYATGSVTDTGSNAGGLVGVNATGSTISNAYATGNVSGSDNVGGLVGWSHGATISNTYATGTATSATSHVGGLVGLVENGSTVSNSHWDTTTGNTTGIGLYLNNNTTNNVSGLSTAALSSTSLSSLFGSANAAQWTNDNNLTTPYLVANEAFSTVSGHVILGADSSTTPSYYGVIQNLTQLQNINTTGLADNYVLVTDIDATATSTWNANKGFMPIGTVSAPFTGIFDGLKHTISHPYINRPSTGDVGLFGHVGLNGVVRNVGLVGANITGSFDTGALVGSIFDGTVSNAYATGVASGTSNVGGLVGSNTGSTISNAYVTVSVSGTRNVGGLVGYNGVDNTVMGLGGTIANAYATGSVSGNTHVGGLVGSNAQSLISGVSNTISNAYATGSVNGSTGVGGLVGTNKGTVSNGYWDTSSGLATGINSTNNATVTGGGGLTSAQMKQQSSFAGFDFTSPVWVIYNGHTAPLLNAFLTPLTITSSDQIQTYNGGTFSLLNPSYSVTGADTSGHLFGLVDSYGGATNVGTYSPDLWSDQQGYRIVYSGGSLTIDPKALNLTGLTADNKVYDGTVAATVSSFGSLAGIVAGDSVSLVTGSTSASFADPNAGTGKTVTVTGLGLSGTSASNYSLASTDTTIADITPKALNLTGLTADNKVYDGTVAATVSSFGSLAGIVAGDSVSLVTGSTSASFADPNAGTGKTVTVTGLGLSGTSASNYSLATTDTTIADITPLPLTVTLVGSPTKNYDGTTVAYLSPGDYQLSGFVAGQGASITQTLGAYASSQVGNNIPVTVSLGTSDYQVGSGTLLGNYLLPTSVAGTGQIKAVTSPIIDIAVATAIQGTSRGYTGVDGFAVPLDPRLRISLQSPGKPTGVHLVVRIQGAPPASSRCTQSVSIDPFAFPVSTPGGDCKKH